MRQLINKLIIEYGHVDVIINMNRKTLIYLSSLDRESALKMLNELDKSHEKNNAKSYNLSNNGIYYE